MHAVICMYLLDILQGVGEGGLNDGRCWTETGRTVNQFLSLLETWQYPGGDGTREKERERDRERVQLMKACGV